MNTNSNTKTKATTAYPLVICGVFAAVMVVCSWIAIPLPSGVPINLAVLGVLLSAGCLGFKYGPLTQLVYVLLGCVGLPVFAGFNGGLHVIAGPTWATSSALASSVSSPPAPSPSGRWSVP